MEPRGDWVAGSRNVPLSTQIRGSEKKSVTGAWLVLLLPLGMEGFFVEGAHMPIFAVNGKPNPISLILGVIALLIIARAVWETYRLLRFGDPILQLNSVPIPLGGMLEGQINLGSSFTTGPDFTARLECIHRVLERGAKNSHWVEKVLWTQTQTTSLLPGGIVPISIELPPDQPESNAGFNDQIVWRLTVQARFRGPDFLEKYEIPVEGHTTAAQKITEEEARHQPPATATKKPSALPMLIIGLAFGAIGLWLLLPAVGDLARTTGSLHSRALQHFFVGLLIFTFGATFATLAALAPSQADFTENSFNFRKGSLGGRLFLVFFLALAIEFAAVIYVCH